MAGATGAARLLPTARGTARLLQSGIVTQGRACRPALSCHHATAADKSATRVPDVVWEAQAIPCPFPAKLGWRSSSSADCAMATRARFSSVILVAPLTLARQQTPLSTPSNAIGTEGYGRPGAVASSAAPGASRVARHAPSGTSL